MDRQLQQRVVGAAVLVALGVVFIPIFLDDGTLPPPLPDAVNIPPEPVRDFESRVVPLDETRVEAIEAGLDAELVPPPVEPADEAAPDGAQRAAPPFEPQAPAPVDPQPADAPPAPDAAAAPAADSATGAVAWTVQLGSFSNDANAKRLIEKLRAADYPAYLERQVEADGTAFKVRVGPEIKREDAEALKRTLEEKFGQKGMVLRYQ